MSISGSESWSQGWGWFLKSYVISEEEDFEALIPIFGGLTLVSFMSQIQRLLPITGFPDHRV